MKNLLTLCFYMLVCAVYANDDRNEVQANLKSVTVYYAGAEMIHIASASLKTGNNEVIIDNISNSIDSNSIQIKAPSSVTIPGFEFSSNYLVSTNKSARVQMLQDSLQHLQDNISKPDLSITNTKELPDVLKLNRDIKGQQNGLSITELTKLMDIMPQNQQSLKISLHNKPIKKIKPEKSLIKSRNK